MKRHYKCSFISSGLHFTPEQLGFCCAPIPQPPSIQINKFDLKNSVELLKNKRIELITSLYNGTFPKECEKCIYLESYEDKENNENIIKHIQESKISYIIINHFKHCDSHCIYCSFGSYLKKIVTKPKPSEYYDLLPIIEKLYENNMIDRDNLKVEFQGGSIGVLKEFTDLLKIFVKNNVKDIVFYANSIKYFPEIADAAKKTNCSMITSIDAGTSKTYKKIKLVDKYRNVISNLKKYKQKSPMMDICAKYILLEGINDNEEEIEKFIKDCAKIKLNSVQLIIDFRKIMMFPGVRWDVPEKYYHLFDFFTNKAKQYKIEPVIWEYIQSILEKGYFE